MSLPLRLGLIYLGIIGLLYLVLMFNVIRLRKKHQVGLGVGQNSELERAVRAHGNFSEYVPMMALMLICLELSGFDHLALHIFWILLIVSRVFHFVGLSQASGNSLGRTAGAGLTALCLLGISISLIIHFISLGHL